jgi:hypothetical protein
MRLILSAFVCLALTTAAPHLASAASQLEGSWSGSGYVHPTNGEREKVTCRVVYHQTSETVHSVTATCASASAKIVQTGELTTVKDGRYIGDFTNKEYNISGSVRVVVKGNSQDVTFSSSSGTGTLALKKR